ncbi:MAG: RidA family protein [Candidatus Bipolaricaulis sibiricus]|uniref:RidA family protein n=1 Tax=Bipolaricaulis sibiricus TaxID=2501609 RepID=A0A410FTX0_BIPS1|nr:MAG: RidA family protein [Candidatus Bipolaricaulis sibiricus]
MPGRPVVPAGTAVAGPYSPAVQAGGFLFVSGQLPVTAGGALLTGSIADQTRQCLENVGRIVQSAGGTVRDLVKVTIFLADMDDFAAVNTAYAAFLGAELPARSCVEVSRLPKDARIEIEAIAYLGS